MSFLALFKTMVKDKGERCIIFTTEDFKLIIYDKEKKDIFNFLKTELLKSPVKNIDFVNSISFVDMGMGEFEDSSYGVGDAMNLSFSGTNLFGVLFPDDKNLLNLWEKGTKIK